ncbi:MAG: hypothetical protein WCE49_17355, partial [Terrimicrobiaceae bacterium]
MPFFHRLARLACCALLSLAEGRAVEFIDPAALGFGSPAFTIDATYQGTLDFENRAGGLEAFELRTVLPVAKWQTGSWLMGASVNYSWRHADFGRGFGLGDKDLHSLDAQFTVAWRPKESQWWALGFVTPGLGSDFEAVDSDALNIAGLALLGYRLA